MGKDLRTCVCCKKQYSFCPNCNPADRLLEAWHFAYCSSNCRTIDKTLTAYDKGDITVETAKATIDKCDLSRRSYFGESYGRILEQIENGIKNVQLDFPYINAPIEENSTAIADEKLKDEAPKKAIKIVKKSVATKILNGDLENS